MMHIGRLFLLVLLLYGGSGEALANGDAMLVQNQHGLELLEQGRAAMIGFRLDEAEAIFERLARVESGNPAAAVHLAKIAWWRALTLEQDELTTAFFQRSDELLEVLRRESSGPWINLFRGETELHRTVLHAKNGSYTRAALALRQAYNHFERNSRSYPDFQESRWGMGLCQAIVAIVPSSLRWVLNTLGFRGTITQGLREISGTAVQGRYYRDEASIIHALLDEFLNDSRSNGLQSMRRVQGRYPDSPLVQYLSGVLLLNSRNAVEAETMFRRAASWRQTRGVYPLHLTDYYLGDALFRQNRFDEAATLFERFLTEFPGQAHKAQAAIRAGLSREMLGNRSAAIRHYRSISVRNDYDSDAAARREADQLLRAPLTQNQRELLMGRNAYDGGQNREAISLVQRVLTDRSAAEVERAEAAYRSGRAYHALENWPEALRHYQIAVSRPGDPLAKWGPWSQFHMGQVYEAQGNRAEARTAYQRALAYDQAFEYHKSLEQRARAALAQL